MQVQSFCMTFLLKVIQIFETDVYTCIHNVNAVTYPIVISVLVQASYVSSILKSLSFLYDYKREDLVD